MPSLRLRPTTGVLVLACSLYFITYVDRVNLATAANDIKADLHLTNTDLGLAFSAFAIVYGALMVVGGLINDRYGARRTLTVAGVLWAGGTVGTALAQGLASLFAARLIVGIGESAATPGASRALLPWTPLGRRGFVQGLMHAFGRLGNATTPPLVAALILTTSWQMAFVVMGAASMIWVAVWVWYYRDDPRRHADISPEELATLPVVPVAARGARPIKWLSLLRTMLPVTLVSFCHGWTLWYFLNWMPLFFANNEGLDLKHSALFSAGVFLGGGLGTLLGGTISDWHYRRTGNLRSARRTVTIFGLVSPLPFLAGLFMTHDLVTTSVCLAIVMFLSELVTAPLWAIAMDLAPHHSGTAGAIMNTGLAIAAAISPILVGWLLDVSGSWNASLAACAAVLLISPLPACLIHADRPYLGDAPSPCQEETTHGVCPEPTGAARS